MPLQSLSLHCVLFEPQPRVKKTAAKCFPKKYHKQLCSPSKQQLGIGNFQLADAIRKLFASAGSEKNANIKETALGLGLGIEEVLR